MLALVNHRTKRLRPRLRHHTDLSRKVRNAQFHIRYPLPQSIGRDIRKRLRARSFVIDANARGRSSGGEPVYRYPRQDLVVGPLVAVGPVVEFLVDPG